MNYDEEEEPCGHEHQVVYVQQAPNWQWSTADVFGVVLGGVGALLIVSGQVMQAVAREFNAAGNFGREKKAVKRQERAARREIASLREMYEAGAAIPEDGS